METFRCSKLHAFGRCRRLEDGAFGRGAAVWETVIYGLRGGTAVGKSTLPVSYDGAGPHASLAACGPGDRRGPHRRGASVDFLAQTHLGIAAAASRAPPAPSYQPTSRVELQVTSTRRIFPTRRVRATTSRVDLGGYASRTRYLAKPSRRQAQHPRPFSGKCWNTHALNLDLTELAGP